MLRFFCLLILTVALTACTKKESTPTDPKLMTPEQLKSRGQQIYFTNCTSCHNANPTRDGSVGPSLAGASLEVIKARVTGGTYPAGYKPKRSTAVMPPLPHLAPEVEALAAFLRAYPNNP